MNDDTRQRTKAKEWDGPTRQNHNLDHLGMPETHPSFILDAWYSSQPHLRPFGIHPAPCHLYRTHQSPLVLYLQLRLAGCPDAVTTWRRMFDWLGKLVPRGIPQVSDPGICPPCPHPDGILDRPRWLWGGLSGSSGGVFRIGQSVHDGCERLKPCQEWFT